MQTYDLQIYQGTDFELNIGLTDSFSNPIDLTNCIANGFIKFNYQTGDFVSLNPTIGSPPTNGNLTLSVPASGTSTLPPMIGLYNIILINTGTNATSIILNGNVYVTPMVMF